MLRLLVLLTAVVCCNANQCRKEMLPTQDTTSSPQGCPDSVGNLHELYSEWENNFETCVCANSGIICCLRYGGYGPFGQYGGYGPFGQYGGYGPFGQYGGYGPFGQYGGYGPFGQYGGYGPFGQYGGYGPFGQFGGHGPIGPTEYYGQGDSWDELYGKIHHYNIGGNGLHDQSDSTAQPTAADSTADDHVTDDPEPVK